MGKNARFPPPFLNGSLQFPACNSFATKGEAKATGIPLAALLSRFEQNCNRKLQIAR